MYMRTYVHEGLVNRLEIVWLIKLTISHDHSCWLRRKESKQTKNNFSRQRGVSSRPKHMRMDAKTVIYPALVPCYKFACHVLHAMETYGSMYDDPYDWQSCTSDKSVGTFLKSMAAHKTLKFTTF